MSGTLLCALAAAVPLLSWVMLWATAAFGMTRAMQPRPHRARALAARIVRELGGRIEEGERGQWSAVLTRGALEAAARVSSSGFGDIVALEVVGPRPWVPEGTTISVPRQDRGGVAAPINLTRDGSDRRWSVVPEAMRAALEPALLEWLFSPASHGVLEVRDRLVRAMYRRDDSNDEAHVDEIRRTLDALLAITS